jgi:RHS repeat-associated protein
MSDMAVSYTHHLSRACAALLTAAVAFLGGWSSPLLALESSVTATPAPLRGAAASNWLSAMLPLASGRQAAKDDLAKSGIESPLGEVDAASEEASERLERIAMLTRFWRPTAAAGAQAKAAPDVDAVALADQIVSELNALGDYEGAVESHWQRESQSMARLGVPGQIVSRQAQLMAEFRREANEFRRLSRAVERAAQGRGRADAEGAIGALADWFAGQQNLKAFVPITRERLPLQFLRPESTPEPADESGSDAKAAADPAGAFGPPTEAELSPVLETALNAEIRALADELGNDPVAIRNWVYNHIEFDPTFGSIQGAALTLLNRHGNAHDIASLSIALLRAAGIPARYVQGNIELPVEQVQNWLGNLATPAMAADLLQRGGVPTTALVSGSQIRALRLTHVWVEAFVDFTPSRGAVNRSPDQWVPLDAAFKQFEYQAELPWRQITNPGFEQLAVDFAQGVQIDASGGMSGFDYDTLDEGIQQLARDSAAALEAQHPGATPEDLRTRRSIVPVERLLLEGSLPYPVVSAAPTRYATVPAGLRHSLRIAFFADETSLRLDSPTRMVDVPLAQIGTQRLWVDYAPASETDAQAIAQYAAANAESMPIGQINVRTLLKLGDTVLFDGGVARMGTLHYYTADLRNAHGQWTRTEPYRFAAGSHVLFLPNLAGITPERAERETAELPDRARLATRDFLYFGGLTFWMLHDRIDEETARHVGGRALRLPSIGTFSAPLQVRYYFGIPRTGSFKGYSTDVKAVRTALALPNPNDTYAVALQLGAGGSLAESVSWNLVTGTPLTNPGVSSAAAIRTAIGEGQRLFQIDASNVTTALAQLQLSADAENEIRAAAQAGMIVVAHERELENRGWRGAGYVIIDPVGGGSIQRLEGGLAGGINMGCLAQAVLLTVLCELKIARRSMELLGGLVQGEGDIAIPLMMDLLGPAELAVGPVVAITKVAVSYAMAAYEVHQWLAMVMAGVETLSDEDLVQLGIGDLNEVLCSYVPSCFGAGPAVGNPTLVGLGAKWQIEPDYQGAGPFPLAFVRTYSSAIPRGGSAVGAKWSGSYFARLRLPAGGDGGSFPASQAPDKVLLVRPDGGWLQFDRRGETYVGESNLPGTLVREVAGGQTIGWRYQSERDEIERFSAEGRLLSIAQPQGATHSLHYDLQGRLIRVEDGLGRSLRFEYDPATGFLTRLFDPANQTTTYRHDARGNLVEVQYPDGNSRRYHYEHLALVSHLTGISDERGLRISTYRYDHRGRVRESSRAGGVEGYSFAYGRDTTTVTDPYGTERIYRFVKKYDRPYLASVSEPCSTCGSGGSAETTYDSRGYVSEQRDFRGNITRFVRNERGLVESHTEAVGTPEQRTTTTTWHPEWRKPLRMVEPIQGGSRTTEYTYDPSGNRTRRTVTANGETRVWTYTYDALGQVESIDGPRTDVQDVLRFEYDAATGNLLRSIDANQLVTRTTRHDAHGRVLERIDPNGLVTAFEYDLRGRVRFVRVGTEGATPQSAEYRYTPAGQLARIALPDGSALEYGYDDASRLESIQDVAGNRIVYTLDVAGNPVLEQSLDVRGEVIKTVRHAIDALGRIEAVGGADPEAMTRFEHDPSGNQRFVKRPLHARASEQQFDALDRLRKAIDPMLGEIAYGYDVQDNLRSVTDPRGLTTSYGYNGFDELTRLDSPDTGVTTYRNDVAGNRIEQTDARGVRATYRYDAANRLQAVAYPDETLAFAYDDPEGGAVSLGRLTSAATAPLQPSAPAATSLRYQYDAQGRMIGKQQSAANAPALSVAYRFDAQGRPEGMTLPSGAQVSYGYGSDGRVSSLRVNGVELIRQIEHFPFGGLAAWGQGPGGAQYRRTFDGDGRIQSHTLGSSNRRIEFDAADRITGIEDDDTTPWSNWTYAYDDLDRLTQAGNAAGSGPVAALGLAWSYDPTGNRTAQTKQAPAETESTAYAIDPASNRLDRIETGTQVDARQYDAVGNMIRWVAQGGDHQGAVLEAVYTGRNRLTEVRHQGVPIARYAYNARGERIGKWLGAAANTANAPASQQFLYDEAGRLLGEYDASGTLLAEHLWLGDTPVAVLKPAGSMQGGQAVPAQGMAPALDAYFVQPDHLNTPRAILNAASETVWRWESAPFGETEAEVQPNAAIAPFAYQLRFPGQYFDAENGLHYNYFRDYEAATGRYIESDPIGLGGGINTYAYVMANPLSSVDLLGLSGSHPGGPYHPPENFKTKCRPGDSCPVLLGKMWVLARMIVSHQGWDWIMPAPRGGSRHSVEIAQLWVQYAECMAMVIKRCGDACKKMSIPRMPVIPIMINPCLLDPMSPACHQDPGMA